MSDAGPRFGLPELDERTRPFFTAGALVVQGCEACEALQHPPEELCRSCGGVRLSPRRLAGTGAVVSRTVVHHAAHPAWADAVPYVVVLVAPDGAPGVRIVGGVRGAPPDAVWIGQRVRAVFETAVSPDTGERLRIPQWEPLAG